MKPKEKRLLSGLMATLLNCKAYLMQMGLLTYKLHAKRDYAGAIVETAIDDMDENSFTALTKIYAEKFIRVQDLAS